MKFILRTTDTAWINRNQGTLDDDQRVTVEVPATAVARVTFAGRDWLRHTFTDIPDDAANGAIMCPVSWLPERPR